MLFKELRYKYTLCREHDYSYTRYQTDNLLSSLLTFCACWPFPGSFWLFSCVQASLGKVTHTHTHTLCRTATVAVPLHPEDELQEAFSPIGQKSLWSSSHGSPGLEALSFLEKTVHVNSCMWSRHAQQLAVCTEDMPQSWLRIKNQPRFQHGRLYKQLF